MITRWYQPVALAPELMVSAVLGPKFLSAVEKFYAEEHYVYLLLLFVYLF